MPETTQFGGHEESSHIDGALKANTILVARYKIMAVLGGGGQGAVYQARDLNFPEARRLVAIKEMHVNTADPNLRASTMKTFQREANILATLTHPAVPKIYDFFDQNDRAYLVMEYINGNDLEALIAKTKSLPMDKIIEWAIDLCDVLSYLHNHQPEPIIFRDMKPANVMIDSLGKVRLIDFGIAKVFVSGVKQTMIGTEGYSAPEQYKGEAEQRSDIYSLGATLHHLITRRDPRLEPPFSFSERPLQDLNDDVPPGLPEIIDKALGFEAEKRYQTALEMKEDLMALRYRPLKEMKTRNFSPGSGNGVSRPISPSNRGNAPTPQATGTVGFTEDLFGDYGGVEPRWKFTTEDEIRSNPIAHDGFAFVGSYDTNIWALELETGAFRWKHATEGGVAASPVIDEQHRNLLFGSEDYGLHTVEYKTGRTVWTFRTNDKVRSSPFVAHGHAFFGSDDGKVYAVSTSTGSILWEYDTGAAVRTRPYVTNERVIVGSDLGEVIGLELNGTRSWAYRTRRGVISSPMVDIDGICYIGAMDGFLYALDAMSGFSHWKFRTNGSIISSPEVFGTYVYFGSTDGVFYAVNTQTGKERWRYTTEKPIVSSPVYHEGAVYFGGTDNKIYALDARTGKEMWVFTTKGPITSKPFPTDNLLLVGSMDRTLYALPIVAY